MNNLKTLEKNYLNSQKEKILDFTRECYLKNEITEEQMNDTYFNLFIKKNDTK